MGLVGFLVLEAHPDVVLLHILVGYVEGGLEGSEFLVGFDGVLKVNWV